jgi:hypothetical protein
MAGSLIKINETTVTSNQSSVAITGIDNSYNVYIVKTVGMEGTAHDQPLRFQVTESGTGSGDSDYDYSLKNLGVNGAYDRTGTNDTSFTLEFTDENTAQAQHMSLIYCYNFSSTTEYALVTIEGITVGRTQNAVGVTGGGVYTQTGTARDGLSFFQAGGGNIRAGHITLYALKK